VEKMVSYDGDRDLLKRVARGEKSAIEDLYKAYVDGIYRSVFNQVGRNEQTAQDIVQDTFIAAMKSAGSFGGRSTAYTWLYAIAHRKVADYYRKKKLNDKHFMEYREEPEKALELLKDPVDLENNSIAKTYVQEVMRKMPLHYRQALLLKYIDGLSMAEISFIMGKSIKSIEGILSRAREELRLRLGEFETMEKT
jgi:RNA polymerase sigma-70 factor (ECF subfamily)